VRIDALVIPPAWTDVWICANPNGHLQATGRDARGRKQYRYHPLWIAERDANKFEALEGFALALPRIRRRVAQDLSAPQLTKRRVLAAVVQLIDRTFIRVGGERYRRDNGSFGATTLRNRHVQVVGEEIAFDFRGKSGKRHRIEIHDGRVASVVRRCLEYPGQLFVYREGGEVKTISAADVNEYLAEASGRSVTSKDFRTWGGTVRAAEYLSGVPREHARPTVKKHIRDAISSASRLLGNTPAVCRKSYIHPAVFQCYEAGIGAKPKPISGLRTRERAALSLLAAMP
jgi:DNA topoisomerase-1